MYMGGRTVTQNILFTHNITLLPLQRHFKTLSKPFKAIKKPSKYNFIMLLLTHTHTHRADRHLLERQFKRTLASPTVLRFPQLHLLHSFSYFISNFPVFLLSSFIPIHSHSARRSVQPIHSNSYAWHRHGWLFTERLLKYCTFWPIAPQGES